MSASAVCVFLSCVHWHAHLQANRPFPQTNWSLSQSICRDLHVYCLQVSRLF